MGNGLMFGHLNSLFCQFRKVDECISPFSIIMPSSTEKRSGINNISQLFKMKKARRTRLFYVQTMFLFRG